MEQENKKSEETQDKAKEEKVEKIKKEEVSEEKKVQEKPAEADSAKESKEKPKPTGKFKDIIKEIEALSVVDLAALVKELEERFGVSAAAAPVAAAGAPAAMSAGAQETEEEKTEFTLVLSDSGAQKIAVIKALREVNPELGLKEAKDLADGAPKTVKEGMSKKDAEEAKKKLEAAGAKVELK